MFRTMATKLSICVMCGLPGSGKTSLCRVISELASVKRGLSATISTPTAQGQCDVKSGISVVHICYDAIIPEKLDPAAQLVSSDNSRKHTLWKEYRNQILECLDFIISMIAQKKKTLQQVITSLQIDNSSTNSTYLSEDVFSIQQEVHGKMAGCFSEAASQVEHEYRPIIFLIDDNMFYRSMRYSFFQLARKYSTGFCQIGFDCSPNFAISRNARRTNRIPEETILTMATKIELPDASKATWEENSLLVDADEQVDHAILAPMWMRLQSSFLLPVPPLPEDDKEAKELSRAECAASLLHQADQVMRKFISETMATAKGSRTTAELKDMASELNRGKAAVLDELRSGILSPPSLSDDEQSRENIVAFVKECLSRKIGAI